MYGTKWRSICNMERTELPENTLSNLKCSLCDGYLSIPPIMVISENGDQICGRCKDVPSKLKIRNVTYENIAERTMFPCLYPTCSEKISWQEVEEHERTCQKARMRCPVFRNCQDIYEISEIKNHFENKHRELLHLNTMVCDTFEPSSNVFLLVKENKEYLVYVYFGKFFWTAVFTFNRAVSEQFRYTLRISSSQAPNGISVSSNEHQIKIYNERECCARCLFDFGKCPMKFHKNCNQLFNFCQMMTTKIDKAATKNLVNTEFKNITWSVSIFELQAANSNAQGSCGREFFHNNNNNLLQHLECPICNVYMYKPIFVCSTGHTICQVCKPQLASRICPTCKSDFYFDSRNYTLEEMADLAEIPCRYQNGGCNFFGNTERILAHESDCSYKN